MSDQDLKELQELHAEVKQLKNQVQGMNCQISACKQLLSESLDAAITLRTNLMLYQKAHADLVSINDAQAKDAEVHKKQIAALAQKILELQPGPVSVPVEEPQQPDGA